MSSPAASGERAPRAGPRKTPGAKTSAASAAQPMTVREFHQALDRLSTSHTRYENFRNFMEAGYASLARRTVLSRARSDALEEGYMSVVRRYARDPEVPRRMAHLFGRLLWTLEGESGDFLGEAYMTAEFGNQYAGQYFTPFCVSSLLARMLVSPEHVKAEIRERGHFSFMEPAAGSGGMVIAVAEHLQEQGIVLADALFVTTVDIDLLCTQMTLVQLHAKGIPAVCVHGDSLALEEYSSTFTIAGARQRGLPIWGIEESPPLDFAIDVPTLVRGEADRAKRALPTASLQTPSEETAAPDAGSPDEPGVPGQISLF